MATELLFSELKAWLDAQPENTASTPYEIIIKEAPQGGLEVYTKAITRFVIIMGMEMEAGVTSIGDRSFVNCTNLVHITIPNGVTTIINQAFQGCKSLISVTLPPSLTSINFGAFSGCSSLTYISIPYGVTSIGDFAFGNCKSLTIVYVYIPFSETLMHSKSFTNTPSNIRLLVSQAFLSGWQSATLTNYGFASGARVEPLYTKWFRVA